MQDNVFVFDHPLIQHKVSLLRDENTSTKEFRELVSEIAMLMAYEVTRDLPMKEVKIKTPVAEANVKMLAGQKIANDILEGKADRGIAICGTGIGISIVVNKFKGIRCGLCSNEYTARMCRQHNDAQVMAMGARVTGQAVALSMVDAFLDEPFAGDRHAVRVNDIKAQEEEFFK